MKKEVKKAQQIYRKKGLVSLFRRANRHASQYFIQWIFVGYYRVIYNKKIVPKREEKRQVDPCQIDFSISSQNMPDSRLQFGILDGDWDKQKIYWRDTWANGLVERFEQEKEWEETSYYLTGIERLQSGGSLGRLDGKQSITNFKRYLDELDELYEDICSNGYDQSSVIKASIGRDGEWIVHNGNHRRAITRIIGVDSISVQIKYRHSHWQSKREEVYNIITESNSKYDVSKRIKSKFGEKFLKHPDIQAIVNG